MSAPAWAAELVAAVCADAEAELPRVAWRRRAGEHSTGVTRRGEAMIAVRAGSDPLDQRLTLLHELAHWINPPPNRRRRGATHHGLAFYRTAFHLYLRHGLSAADALRLEAARYPSSLRHAAALKIPGAQALLEERRLALRERPRRTWRVLVPEHRVTLRRDGRWHVCETCGQRVVARALARIRRGRRPVRHVLLASTPPVAGAPGGA
jgi:hypothetical protein